MSIILKQHFFLRIYFLAQQSLDMIYFKNISVIFFVFSLFFHKTPALKEDWVSILFSLLSKFCKIA